MDPWSAGASVLGLAGGLWSNQQNLAESKRARQWSERMSGSAYQRAVADMKLAGLNPLLAYSQGGASTPGASTATVDDVVSPAVSSAQHARRLSEELQVMRGQRAVQLATQNDLYASQQLKYAQRDEALARTANTSVNTALEAARLPAAEAAARAAGGRFGTTTAYLQRLRESIFGGAGMLVAPSLSRLPRRR